MLGYIIRRLLLIIPTLLAILTLNFFVVQIAPGGPVDQAIAMIEMGIDSSQNILPNSERVVISNEINFIAAHEA